MSEVWKYSLKQSTSFAKCQICKEEVPRRGHTTNLMVHLKKHPNKEKALENVLRHQESVPVAGRSACSIKTQKSLEHFLKETEVWADHGTKTNEIDDAIAFMVIRDYQPVSIVEDEGFVNLLKLLAPKYRIPQRRVITRIIGEKYEKVAKKTKDAIVIWE
ncbi:uncharacterized protein LOC110677634 [Aedes aegypti]|uniref:Uncharacterized protein n=1 Tax=Aedes aegypti TaxID=7159 RepID=A0A6I8TYE9_AEDAE|nr:uncharacterized protein LOC110677634 [Aedes aegypti]